MEKSMKSRDFVCKLSEAVTFVNVVKFFVSKDRLSCTIEEDGSISVISLETGKCLTGKMQGQSYVKMSISRIFRLSLRPTEYSLAINR